MRKWERGSYLSDKIFYVMWPVPSGRRPITTWRAPVTSHGMALLAFKLLGLSCLGCPILCARHIRDGPEIVPAQLRTAPPTQQLSGVARDTGRPVYAAHPSTKRLIEAACAVVLFAITILRYPFLLVVLGSFNIHIPVL